MVTRTLITLSSALLALSPPAMANGRSDFLREHCLYVRKGRLEARSWTPTQILQSYATKAAGQPLVIHFHGGLVSAPTAENEAVDLYNKAYAGAGYPVYFVWNADFWSQLNNTLDAHYGQGALLQGRLSTTQFLQFIYARTKTAGQDLSRNTSDLMSAYRRYMSADPAFQKAVRQEAIDTAKRKAKTAGSHLADWTKADTWMAAKNTLQKRVTDYFSPYVEGVARNHDSRSVSWSGDTLEWVAANFGGKEIWNRMKADTTDSFAGKGVSKGAGLQFLLALAQVNPKPSRIVLVGHSTGCIYILNFLRAAKTVMPGTQFDVVFLAPVNTYRDMASFLLTSPDSIRNFRMFGMDTASERKDHMLWEINPNLQGLYPGSLSTFVSRAVEDRHNMPLIGLQQDFGIPFLGPDRTYSLIVHQALLDAPGRVVWSPNAGAMGLCSTCAGHGEFCSDAPTLTSLHYLVSSSVW